MAIDPSTLEWGYRTFAGSDSSNQKANYSLNFKSNGQDLTFIPTSVINKGVSAGDNNFVMPWFLNKDNMATLGKQGQYVDLAGNSWYGDYLKDTIGASTTGFLVPTGSIPFDSDIKTVKDKVKGIAQTEDGPSYILDSQGNDGKYIKPNGNTVTLTKGRSLLGNVFGGLGDSVANAFNDTLGSINELGPWANLAISAVNPVAGAAIAAANIGSAVGSGKMDIEDAAKAAAIAYAGSQLGGEVGGATGSQAAGQFAGSTTSGLLQGQNLESSLTNAAVNTGANQAAGGLMSAVNPPAADPYAVGGVYGPDNIDVGGGWNPAGYSGYTYTGVPTTAEGVQVPTQEGATLGSIGAEAEASNGNPNLVNSAATGVLSGLFKSLFTGSTSTGSQGTGNMATTTDNTNALSSLLGGLLGGAGSLMQGSTNVEARQQQADALRQAGQQAATASQFRPVGTTTRFGSSNFQVDPTTGQLVSAGYNASGLAQGYQDQLAGMTSQGLMQGQTQQNLANQYLGSTQGQPVQALGQQLMGSQAGQPLTSLGQQYLGESPDAIRQRYVQQQTALLAPQQEQQLAGVRNNLFQTGRQGLATGATSAGNLAATNPEMAAYYNSIANQQRQIAAGADAAAQQQAQLGSQLYGAGTNLTQGQQVAGAGLYGTGLGLTQQGQQFGQQLGTNAFSPFTQGFGAQAAVEGAAQQPFNMSADLAAQFQKANAQGGALNLNAQNAATQAMLPANQYNPYASLLSGSSGNTQLTGALGGLLGNTGLGKSIGSLLGGLGGYDLNALNTAASDWMTANPGISPTSTFNGSGDASWMNDWWMNSPGLPEFNPDLSGYGQLDPTAYGANG